MLDYKKVAVIDHDWSLYRLHGVLNNVNLDNCYAIIHDEDVIDGEFWHDLHRVMPGIIHKRLGERMEDYYD